MDNRTLTRLDPSLQQLIDREIDEHIDQRLHQLEDRVYALEHRSIQPEAPAHAATLAEPFEAALTAPPEPESTPRVTIETSASTTTSGLPILGKAVFGFAGAYLLRALEESHLAPPSLIIALAVAYATLWLLLSARLSKVNAFAAAAYATTSCLILAPMLLELTLRFQLLSPGAAAAILAAFALAALLLSTTPHGASVFWTPWLTSIGLALLLMAATHHLAPFIVTLFLFATAAEITPIRGRARSAHLFAAPALDAALLLLLLIYTSAASSRPDYPALTPTLLLAFTLAPFVFYAAVTAIHTLLRNQPIGLFDIAQTIATFLIAFAAFQIFHPPAANRITGSACLLLAAACYAAFFTRFRSPTQLRNRRTYSLWSAALLLLGCILILRTPWLALELGVAAIATALLSSAPARASLRFHALLYLAAAAYFCGLHQFIAHTLTAATIRAASPALITIAACSALTAYFTQCPPSSSLFQRIPTIASTALAAASAAALLVHFAAGLISTAHPGPVALAQTFITCTLALALMHATTRTHRREFLWIAYAAVIAIAAKLLLIDTRQDHFAWIAGSFILYAVTLITLPRLTRSTP
ncbi:MAG: hypothetical protein V4555_14905 [Acidobacteriota bacterium]